MIYRTVENTIKPTVTEIAGEIWELDVMSQATLLYLLNKRFCSELTAGRMQLAAVYTELNNLSKEKAAGAKHFVKLLSEYIVEDPQCI